MKAKFKKIHTLEDLSALLGVTVDALTFFSNNMPRNVNESKTPKKGSNNKFRTITSPSRGLKKIQRAIKNSVLSKYKYPVYVYGLGGNTLKQHAFVHSGDKKLVQVDLNDFYPSISNKLVYIMWIDKFKFSPEVSRMLTKLTTMGGGLKQGFPTSSHIAAIVAEEFTSAIYKFCNKSGLTFSQYVDDLNISGDNIDYRMVFKTIVPLGRPYGLTIKKSKTKVNSNKDGKTITGVSLFNLGTRATRDVRHRAMNALKVLANKPDDEFSMKRVSGYLGFLKHLSNRDGARYKSLRDQILKKRPKP